MNFNQPLSIPSTPCAHVARFRSDKYTTPPNAPIKSKPTRKLLPSDDDTHMHCNIAKRLEFGDAHQNSATSSVTKQLIFEQQSPQKLQQQQQQYYNMVPQQQQGTILFQQQQQQQNQRQHVQYAMAMPMSQEKQFSMTHGNDDKKRCFGEYRQSHATPNTSSTNVYYNFATQSPSNGSIVKRRKV